MLFMTNSLDRTSARSSKGWLSGGHLARTDLDRFLDDSEIELFHNSRKGIIVDTKLSMKRPEKSI